MQPGTGAVGAVTHTGHPGSPWSLAKHSYHTVVSLVGLVAFAEGSLAQHLVEVGGDGSVTCEEPPPRYFPGVYDCQWKYLTVLPFLPWSPRS